MDSEYRLTTYLQEMREKFQVTPRGAKVYIARLDDQIMKSKKGMRRRKLPNQDFPELDVEFKGCVYVGTTKLTVYKRFRRHLEGHRTASWALNKFPASRKFKECAEDITELYGFTHLHKECNEKIESWVGYALYEAGYWVWGPHAHESHKRSEKDNPRNYDDFLGRGDFI